MCVGDSGSPLYLDGDVLIGLVSSGFGYGRLGVPGLNTRAASVRDFIAAYTASVLTNYPPVPSSCKTSWKRSCLLV